MHSGWQSPWKEMLIRWHASPVELQARFTAFHKTLLPPRGSGWTIDCRMW